jgi:CHAT domain-containing protein
LLAPVGIGPLLRARGAPCVVGPLWASDARASALFYDAFHAALPHDGPHAALTKAMTWLRELDDTGLRAWVDSQHDAKVTAAATPTLEWCKIAPDERPRPFANPIFWAQFSLLGGRNFR